MDTPPLDFVKELKKLRQRWRTMASREFRMRRDWKDAESVAKSYGMDITYTACANEIDALLKKCQTKP